jgi:hypothetical protein
MARKKDPPAQSAAEQLPLDKRLPPHRLLPTAHFAPGSWLAVEKAKLNEIGNLLWFPEGISEADKNAKLVKAADLFESLKPADGLEAMLAAQMVGAHTAAMECLRRAMVPGQTFEGRNSSLSHAQRLMGLYARQVAALDKHRGKGQQKVTVEHVHVAAGGQAIVGNIETTAGGFKLPPGVEQGQAAAPALAAPDTPIPDVLPAKAEQELPRK